MKRYDESQFVYCDSPEDCLQAVSEGRADITYVRVVTAQYYIGKGTYPDLMMIGGVALSYPLSIGVSKDADERLLAILDRELVHIGPYKIWELINESSVNLETERSIWSLLYMHPRKTLFAFLLVVAVVMLFLFRLVYMRQRHVRMIQQMLFRDASTQLRNRVWLEAEAVKRMALVSADTMEQCAIVVFVLPKMEYLEAVYDQHVVDEALRKLVLAVHQSQGWGEFEVWYQPKYDLLTRKCVEAEALVRWNSKELGFLLPGQFIDLFERTGFITRLDFYNWEKVFSFQRRRLEHGRPIVPISVNQSRLHLNEPDYLPKWGMNFP